MTDAKAKPPGVRFVLTRPAVLIFNQQKLNGATVNTLFTPTQFKNKGEFKFSAGFVLNSDHPDLVAVKTAINNVAQAASPGIAWNAIGKPLSTGDKHADQKKAKAGEKYDGSYDWMRGKVVLTARSQFQPQLSVFNGKGNPVIQLEDEALKAKYRDKFFWNAEVIAEFAFVWYPAQKEGDKPGVTAYCQAVLATGGGTRTSATKPANETFSAYLGHATTEDPTGGAGVEDDEIPF